MHRLASGSLNNAMGRSKPKRSRKCPGCHVVDSDHSFGPLSKYCPGLDRPTDASPAEKAKKDVVPASTEAGHESDHDLTQELLELEAEEETLHRELEAQSLRAKVLKKRQEVERLKMELKARSGSSESASPQASSVELRNADLSTLPKSSGVSKQKTLSKQTFPTLADLRAEATLASKVDRELAKLKFLDSAEESSSSEEEEARPVKPKGKYKSGRSAKPTSRVVNPQLWPHSELNTSFVSKAVSFETLQLDEFVAGYATILQSLDPHSQEFQSRLEHLISLMYLCSRYEWEAVLDFHGAVLLDIERGRVNWGDSFSYLEPRTLHGHLKSVGSKDLKSSDNSASKASNAIYFCKEFNMGKCKSRKDHFGSFGKESEQRWLRHICSACWLRSRAMRGHAEGSNVCPMKSADGSETNA